MKKISNYIAEKLNLNKVSKENQYKYHPKDKDELKFLVDKLIEERGNKADLNDIDTSQITDMSLLFLLYAPPKFNGDISCWNVSNVKSMRSMFEHSKFNGDISKWDVSNVTDMGSMFSHSKFNGDISEWDVSNVTDMSSMFYKCPLEKNPPKWYKE